jgi:hypothetical protein
LASLSSGCTGGSANAAGAALRRAATDSPRDRLVHEVRTSVGVDHVFLALAIHAREHSLALAIHDLRFLGRCTCTPGCDRLLTAPYEQRSPYVAQLAPDEDIPAVWLGLSEDFETITDIQVMDAALLGPQARAELRRLFHPLREGETWCA